MSGEKTAHSDAVALASTATVTEDKIRGKRDFFLCVSFYPPPPVGCPLTTKLMSEGRL